MKSNGDDLAEMDLIMVATSSGVTVPKPERVGPV